MAKTQASVRWATDGTWLIIRTPYSAEFVTRIKDEVSYSLRKWDGVRRVWMVSDEPRLRSVVRTIVDDVFSVELDEPEGRTDNFTTPGSAGGPRGEGPSTDARELATLKLKLAEAQREIVHLNRCVQSANADATRWRRMAGDSMFGGGSTGGALDKILRSGLGEKAFKKLATVLHPDAGGDTELFKELEQAWAKVKR